MKYFKYLVNYHLNSLKLHQMELENMEIEAEKQVKRLKPNEENDTSYIVTLEEGNYNQEIEPLSRFINHFNLTN